MRRPSSLLGSQSQYMINRHRRSFSFIWWLRELSCWLLSLVFFSGIVATLFTFQGHPIPNWPYGITVNTIIAILSALETLLLQIPIASAIAQLRWNWFHKKRPLIDFVKIGEASQGAFGSAKLLWHRSGGIPSLSGAGLMILVLTLPPLFQQVVSYKEIAVLQGEASISTNLRWVGSTQNLSPSIELSRAIFEALGTPYQVKSNPSHICSTGNCTWPLYQSLAVCSACNDITGFLDSDGRLSDNFGWNVTDQLLHTDQNGWDVCSKWPLMSMRYYDNIEIPQVQDENIIWKGAFISAATNASLTN